MARVPIAELTADQLVAQPFLVVRAQLRATRSGAGHYIAGAFADRTGQIDFRVWEANSGMRRMFHPGRLIHASGMVEEFNGRLQINVSGFEPAQAGELDAREFIAVSPFEPKALFAELKRCLAAVKAPHLALLRDRYFEDREDFLTPFYFAAASVRNHHNWLHGLMEHTVSALQLAGRVCDHYPDIDRDIVLMGVFLHDAGKVTELTHGPEFEYTTSGDMLGHITLGLLALEKKITAIPNFPRDVAVHLQHCVLAHHGLAEHGSPRPPMSPEALAVHHIECLDAHLASMWQEQAEADVSADPGGEIEGYGVVWSRRFRHGVMVPTDGGRQPGSPPPHLPANAETEGAALANELPSDFSASGASAAEGAGPATATAAPPAQGAAQPSTQPGRVAAVTSPPAADSAAVTSRPDADSPAVASPAVGAAPAPTGGGTSISAGDATARPSGTEGASASSVLN